MKKIMFFLIVVTMLSFVIINCDDSGDNLVMPECDAIAAVDKIYLFSAGPHPAGNAGGREGVDAIAENELPVALSGKTVHAFVSVHRLDSIANMPAYHCFPDNVPVVIEGDTVMAANWTSFMSEISMTIFAAGLTGGSSSFFWTGSNDDGTANNTCNKWTGSGSASISERSEATTGWLNGSDTASCGSGYNLLGIAY